MMPHPAAASHPPYRHPQTRSSPANIESMHALLPTGSQSIQPPHPPAGACPYTDAMTTTRIVTRHARVKASVMVYSVTSCKGKLACLQLQDPAPPAAAAAAWTCLCCQPQCNRPANTGVTASDECCTSGNFIFNMSWAPDQPSD